MSLEQEIRPSYLFLRCTLNWSFMASKIMFSNQFGVVTKFVIWSSLHKNGFSMIYDGCRNGHSKIRKRTSSIKSIELMAGALQMLLSLPIWKVIKKHPEYCRYTCGAHRCDILLILKTSKSRNVLFINGFDLKTFKYGRIQMRYKLTANTIRTTVWKSFNPTNESRSVFFGMWRIVMWKWKHEIHSTSTQYVHECTMTINLFPFENCFNRTHIYDIYHVPQEENSLVYCSSHNLQLSEF